MEAVLYTPTKLSKPVQAIGRFTQPSPEKPTAHSLLLISPKMRPSLFSLPPVSPTNKHVEVDVSNLSPSTAFNFPSTNEQSQITALRTADHVVFDEFTIAPPDADFPRDFTTEQGRLLGKIFPKTRSVGIFEPFLVICVDELPLKPWPITAAGMALYITTDPDDIGFDHHWCIVRGPRLLESDRFAQHNTEQILEMAFLSITSHDIKLISLAYWGQFLVGEIQEDPDTILNKLPQSIAGLSIEYKKAGTDPEGQEKAYLRNTEPTGVTWDTTNYKDMGSLRPGVLLSAKDGKKTSSGIIVRDIKTQVIYMTVAAHGFEGPGSSVYHPTEEEPNANEIGVIERLVGDVAGTDVALVKLHDAIAYDNTPFMGGNELIEPKPISGFSPLIGINKRVSVNSPVAGFVNGAFMGVLLKRFEGMNPKKSSKIEYRYMKINYTYHGNGLEAYLDGTCGAPVLSEDTGKVLSLFWLMQDKNIGYGVSMSVLEEHDLEYVGTIP